MQYHISLTKADSSSVSTEKRLETHVILVRNKSGLRYYCALAGFGRTEEKQFLDVTVRLATR